jgi:putative FmdB family regulatory protein
LPLYEYKCEGCGETFEVIQKFSDEPLTVHQKCGGHVHKLMSAPAFQFKGTGWYVTDYAKGNASGPPKNEGKSESGKAESGKSDSSKTDGKGDSGKSDSGKYESGKSDSSSKSTDTATKTESKPSSSSSSKND